MAERFLYLPSVGFAVLVVYVVHWLWQRKYLERPEYRKAVPAALGVILIAFAARAYARNADWEDQGRFWRSAAEAAPGSYKANLAAANHAVFLNQQDWDRAIGQVDRALAILDKLPDLQNTAIAYQQAGVYYRNAGVRLATPDATGRAGTGSEDWYRKSLNALLRSEKIELAQDEMNRAENAKRGKPNLTFVPSALYLQMGRTSREGGNVGPERGLPAGARRHLYCIAQCRRHLSPHLATYGGRRHSAHGYTRIGLCTQLLN